MQEAISRFLAANLQTFWRSEYLPIILRMQSHDSSTQHRVCVVSRRGWHARVVKRDTQLFKAFAVFSHRFDSSPGQPSQLAVLFDTTGGNGYAVWHGFVHKKLLFISYVDLTPTVYKIPTFSMTGFYLVVNKDATSVTVPAPMTSTTPPCGVLARTASAAPPLV